MQERIASASAAAGTAPDEVTLVAVTKGVGVERIVQAVEAGICHLGENRVQEALEKRSAIQLPVRWHMVGHLQSNKARHCVGRFDLIQSLDRLSLARELAKRASSAGVAAEALIEVNIARDKGRSGVLPGETEQLIRQAAELRGLRILGIMGIAPAGGSPGQGGPYFRELRRIWERIRGLGIAGVEMRHLSMGMSDDFETAVREGSNMVRIGRAIFGSGTGL